MPQMSGTMGTTAANESRHREILRMKLLGLKNTEVANALDITDATVSIIVNSPLFQMRMKEMQKTADNRVFDVLDYMRENAQGAAETIVGVMKSAQKDSTRLSAASKVLAIAGYSGAEPVQGKGDTYIQNNLTFEQRMREFDSRPEPHPLEARSLEPLQLESLHLVEDIIYLESATG